MSIRARRGFVLSVLALTLPGLSLAEDADAREVDRYVLTDAALAKYERAVSNLRPLAEQISSCDEENPDSIGDMAARIDRIPAAKAAIASAGLPTREFVVFMFAAFRAGLAVWAAEQPGGELPPGVSKANVEFYRANREKIEGIPRLGNGCDDSQEEEDPE